MARQILDDNGLYQIRIEQIAGNLTDHYDPSGNVIRLSESVYNSTSVAAIGVAAHECGHAIQDAEGYAPLVLKNTVAPACSVASNIGVYIVLAGIIFSAGPLVNAGIMLFTLGVLVTLLLLPIEYNASDRALEILKSSGLLQEDEMYGATKVLRSAGLTYVAAAASSVLTLLRLLIIARNRDSD